MTTRCSPVLGQVWLPSVLLLLLSGLAAAQCVPAQQSLTTLYMQNNGCSGNFFDVVATRTVTICSFDVSIGVIANQAIEVWARTGGGPYAPAAGTPAAWTLLGSQMVTGTVLNTPVPLNLNLQYVIPAGTTQGFVIRNATSTNMDYTNGVTLGAVAATNADLSILTGEHTCTVGAAFPVVTTSTNGRIWNGTIHYNTENILSVGASAPGAGDLVLSLTDLNPTATEGWILLSLDTSLPAGAGPLLGLVPDASTWFLFLTSPLLDGYPLHFPIPSPGGFFPTIPFYLPAPAVPFASGVTVDFAALLIGPGFTFAGNSSAVRYTF